MPIIPKKNETPVEKKSVNFEKPVLEDVLLYTEFLGMENDIEAISYIVNEGLKNIFLKDRDFQTFKKNRTKKKENKDEVKEVKEG